MIDFQISSPASQIVKSDDAQRIVRGWLFLTVDSTGDFVVDRQGDVVDIDRRTVDSLHKFMAESRDSRVNHGSEAAGEVVELAVVDDEVAAALTPHSQARGVWIGIKLNPETWERFKAGELNDFSLAGSGARMEVEV